MERNHFDRLGGLLKSARKAKGLTRDQLAEILNITPRYLMSIENENKKPSYDVLFRLIRELGMSADTIFYPDNYISNTEQDKLIRLLHLSNEHEVKVIIATATALLEGRTP